VIAPPHSPLHVVDSSGWIEYFTDSPNADEFAAVIEEPEHLLVPSLSILEVFKWVLRERGEDAAIQVTAVMQQSEVIDLDVILALRSAKLGLAHQLPLADSIIYATAQTFGATLWTQDADFETLRGVRYLPKRPA
jgi:predicted nucleic acid-binding protein